MQRFNHRVILNLCVMLLIALLTLCLSSPSMAKSGAALTQPRLAKAPTLVTCKLRVPSNPLSQAGLLLPWSLQPPCHETTANNSVFVQAVIFDPGRGTIETYNPLVVDQGTAPAAPLVSPMLPKGATVAIFGVGNAAVTEWFVPGKPSSLRCAHATDFAQL